MAIIPKGLIKLTVDLFTEDQLREFWGIHTDVSWFTLSDLKGADDCVKSLGYPMCGVEKKVLAAGGIEEMCKYFKVPYPKTEIEVWKIAQESKLKIEVQKYAKKIWNAARAKFPADEKKAAEEYKQDVDRSVKVWQSGHELLRKAIKSSGNHAVWGHHPKPLTQLRACAVWRILILQLELFESVDKMFNEISFATAQ